MIRIKLMDSKTLGIAMLLEHLSMKNIAVTTFNIVCIHIFHIHGVLENI